MMNNRRYVCVTKCPELDYYNCQHCYKSEYIDKYIADNGCCPVGNTPEWRDTRNNHNISAAGALSCMAIMSAVCDNGYSNVPMQMPSGKTTRCSGYVSCHMCGSRGKTLYKCNDGYICTDCKRNGDSGA